MDVATKVTKYVSDARILWKALNGVCVIYKPVDKHFLRVRNTIVGRLCEDLNDMHVRPPTQHVEFHGKTNEQIKVVVRPSFADHILVVGPRYLPQDLKLIGANLLGRDTSGVMVCGINDGTKIVHKIRNSKPTSFFKIKGILGQATDNYYKTGKVVEKSTYNHVKRIIIDKICATIQSSHQKKMFELCGVDIQSQAAYELALKGLIRPTDQMIPMIYTIKCTDFTSPEFTLEIVSINMNEMYLKTLIHELGIKLHTNATCTHIQCTQYGLFNVEQALLSKHWDLQAVLNNMRQCREILDKNQFLLHQENPTLVEGDTT